MRLNKGSKHIFTVITILGILMIAGMVSAGTPNPGSGSVNFTVMNKDATDSANVVASYINASGVEDAAISAVIPALSSAGFPITSSGLPDGWEGSVIVSADKDITAFGQIRWSGGQFGDGQTAGAYNGFGQNATANTLYFPSLKARAGNQFSKISIQSAEGASSSATTTFSVNFYNRDGTLATTLANQTVNKGAQKTYDLLDDVNLPADWNGSAVVQSASPLAGVATTHWKGYSTAYSAVTSGGTVAYVPEARRRLKNGQWDQYTSIVVQNLDTTDAANVKVDWYDRSGTLLHTFNDTIPANSSNGYNTRFGADIPNSAALDAAVGNKWNGSLVITSTNGKQIVAVSTLQWTSISSAGESGTSYTSESTGSARILIPASFRRTDSSWKQFSGVIVQNIGSTACSNFTVDWIDRDGNKMLSYSDSLNAGISHGYNSRYGADIPNSVDAASLGSDFRGSVVINAPGCELIAIHNTVWPLWTDSTTYQGEKD